MVVITKRGDIQLKKLNFDVNSLSWTWSKGREAQHCPNKAGIPDKGKLSNAKALKQLKQPQQITLSVRPFVYLPMLWLKTIWVTTQFSLPQGNFSVPLPYPLPLGKSFLWNWTIPTLIPAAINRLSMNFNEWISLDHHIRSIMRSKLSITRSTSSR